MSARGHTNEDAVMHGEFMAFVTDDDSIATVRDWAERQGYPSATVQQGGPDFFGQMLESSAPPKITLVDIDGQGDPVGVASRMVSLCGAENKIIIIGSANDVSLYRRLIGTGIVDYLVKPLVHENLAQAMAMALRNATAGKPEVKESKAVVVIGTRGGVGASTVAVNTGWLLAHDFKFNCVLLDLDMQFGTSALALDLEPGRGLRDIVSSPHRVDGLMIASSMTVESDQYSVLGAEEAVDEHIEVDSSAITALLKEVKPNFDFAIVDLPRHLIAAQKRLIASANTIVLVTELSLAGIRDTLRIRTAIMALGFTGKIIIAASRVDSSFGQMTPAVFEKGAQIKINLLIPEDRKAMAQAGNTGKPLATIARSSALTKALKNLAEELSGNTADERKKTKTASPSKFGGFFSSKKKGTVKDGGKA